MNLSWMVKAIMASGSLPPSSSKSKPEESPGDGVKSFDFLADTKWWLHQQPKDNSTLWESSWETLEYEKIKAVIGDTSQEAWSQDDHLLISENPEKLISETEPQLTGVNKTEPWWRTIDLDSFVSDKSSIAHFDNLDPLQPEMNKIGQQFVPDKGLASLDHVSNFIDSRPKSPTSIGIGESHSPGGLDNPLSTTPPDEAENLQELTKAELLEALCHSQTRAREAEKAAQEAYNEKEHIITHFLKQASHLFAYKQWFHILQMETACLHLKNSVYTRFPDFVPWVPPTKDTKRVRRRKAAKMKPRYKIGKSFGSFLLGLTLAGAGLLLGWTLGWLFR